MRLLKQVTGLLSQNRIHLSSSRVLLSTTNANRVDEDWRVKNSLPRNPNAYGLLTDSPDFSFVNGRTPAITSGRKRRMEQQIILTDKVMSVVKEMNFAKNRYAQQLEQDVVRRKTILSQKLKPKTQILSSAKPSI